MPFHFRKRPRIGPLQFNLTKRGLSSISLRLGRFTWNSRTRRTSIDLPGPVNWRSNPRKET